MPVSPHAEAEAARVRLAAGGMRAARWTLAGLLLAYGVATLDFFSWKWVVLGLVVYSVPLLGQLLASAQLRAWSLWFGVFMAAQTLLSALVFDVDFVSLPPNLATVVDVKGGLPGISGEQRISTDARGFRTTRPIDYDTDEGYRIFALGGSTTEQIYLDDRRTWTHLLQERLVGLGRPDVRVINAGVAGLRGLHNVATLRQVLAYHPDMVVFLLGINDWNHQIKQHFAPAQRSWLASWKPRRQLFLRHSLLGKLAVGALAALTTDQPQGVVTRKDHGEYYSRQRGSLGREVKRQYLPPRVDAAFADALEQLSAICREAQLVCVFLTQPTGYSPDTAVDYRAGFWMTPPNEDYTLTFDSMVHIAALYNEHLTRFAADNNHPVCDLAGALRPGYDTFYDDCHFNVHGAWRVAELMTACVAPLID